MWSLSLWLCTYMYIQLCVTVAVAVKESGLCACLWGDGQEGQWCRALILSVHDSMVILLVGECWAFFGEGEWVYNCFYMQLPSHPSLLVNIIYMLFRQKLERMPRIFVEHMWEVQYFVCINKYTYKIPAFKWLGRLALLANYSWLMLWSYIILLQADVLFPDYGNQERVAVSELCTLPSQFYQLPFQVRESTVMQLCTHTHMHIHLRSRFVKCASTIHCESFPSESDFASAPCTYIQQ